VLVASWAVLQLDRERAMASTDLVTLSMQELDRLKVIQAVVDDGLKPGRAAARLGLTVRQVERLVSRYKAGGPGAIASRARGRPGNRKLETTVSRAGLWR
jgi:hypothetical protein